ncbi:DUF6192 family protein [Streptomyces sp. 4N124]|uniref:DUF6192 family protein n=1 Tax=Streptomyces sp. 4N124 TaxID=3457420 RepID=UPI003FD2B89E
MVRRHELTDREWELLAPLIPRAATGRPRVEDRQVVNGMVYKIRTGISWRDLPERYGPWNTVYKIEHTIEYLDLVGTCHGFVGTLGRLVPRMRGQEFTDDERETVRRQIGRVRAAADWLEGAVDNGEFTLDEQLAQLLKGE